MPTNAFPDLAGTVDVVRILNTGQMIRSLDEYRDVEDRFRWENRAEVLKQLLNLKARTDQTKRSVIAIYEEGKRIREFANVEKGFEPLAYW